MNDRGVSLSEFQTIIGSLELLKEQSITLSEDNKNKFGKLLDIIENYDNNKSKGQKLEDLIFFLVDNIPIFKGYQNIRTSTNEIDILVRLSDIGNLMLTNGLIDLKCNEILIECKNYDNKKIDVTMVGKFCSLLLHSPSRLGIFVSKNGFKGKGKWDSAKGLVKKFYYYKERQSEKQYVIDITLEEIKKVVETNQFIELLQSKIIELEDDTKYEHFIEKHPAEDYFKNEDIK